MRSARGLHDVAGSLEYIAVENVDWVRPKFFWCAAACMSPSEVRAGTYIPSTCRPVRVLGQHGRHAVLIPYYIISKEEKRSGS